ncbi:PEP-CTERM sorting domain-containing protein [Neorhodopirellula pilleata]|uniref:PEP-CTERM protein-sorting domain-containing protein n=1 Tax=Neorhodopirellula pilleata TaxID=2714738 RepID=A0A5C5ZGC3_9BACT|nr:PEP-CTERM sorting domain-containing protein [Neorhodopirellula pilleata]TWT86382.1 hypothetical protein Pla100_60890 [Neorhodopirellula pilleata]
MKTRFCLLFFLLTSAASVQAAIVSNLVQDPGFESTVSPVLTSTSTPWFTIGEDNEVNNNSTSVIQVTGSPGSGVNSGSRAAQFAFYFDAATIVQNLGVQYDSSKTYEFSFYSRISNLSANSLHINPSTINASIWTSSTINGTYASRGLISGLTSTTTDWTEHRFDIASTFGTLGSFSGEFLQIRLDKPNTNTTHRISIDDVAFGVQVTAVPEPSGAILFALAATAGLGVVRRKRRSPEQLMSLA